MASLSLRTFMWRWSGKWFQIVYDIFFFFRHIIIYLLVFSGQDVLLPIKKCSCVRLVSFGNFKSNFCTYFYILQGDYCKKQIYADNLHNKCRDLSDWVGCKIAWFVQTQSWRNLIMHRFLCYADFSRMNVLICVFLIGNILGIGILHFLFGCWHVVFVIRVLLA